MKSMCLFMIIIVFALTSQACSPLITGTPSNILFSDDFSTTDMKWDRVNETTRVTDYSNNAYQIVVNDTNSDAWANPGNQSFTDVHIEVDATKNGGPDDNEFGIICRYNSVDEFYYAVISSDGYYGIMKMSSDGGMPIGNDSLLESDAINLGAASNHIRFECVGSTLTLYINGTRVDQQTDSSYTSGNVGLLAGTFDTVGTDVLFDNYIIYKP
jgi:hypothetical protein